jgi:HAD superfamily hydrolase (TIGR01549 family)
MQPKGILLDYGGTLVEELGYDDRAGNDWLLRQAATIPPDVSLDDVLQLLDRSGRELGANLDDRSTEVTWQTLTRLVYDSLAVRFKVPLSELELGYWLATAKTQPMPGAIDAIETWHRRGIPMAVVSNCRFSEHVLRHELGRHDLAKYFAFIMVSAEYAARKPSAVFFMAAAQRLGVGASDIWFIGDSLHKDMTGAKAAGMRTLWFRAGASPAHTATVDHSCSSWSEIVGLLDER